MPERGNIPTSAWMTAAEVISWIAFRDPRPRAEWDELYRPRRPWCVGNPQWLLLALSARAKGRVWRPPYVQSVPPEVTALPCGKERDLAVYRARRAMRRTPPFRARHYRARARKLIRETDSSPEKLVRELGWDMIRQKRFERAIRVAKQELLAAAREDRVGVFARRSVGERNFDSGALHEVVPSLAFLGPRVIDEDGWIRPAEPSESDDDGCHRDVRADECTSSDSIQYYDDAHFKTAEVLDIWPARPANADEGNGAGAPAATTQAPPAESLPGQQGPARNAAEIPSPVGPSEAPKPDAIKADGTTMDIESCELLDAPVEAMLDGDIEDEDHKGGRPSDRNKMFLALGELDQEGHRVHDMATPTLADLVAKRCGTEIGKKGWSLRTVQDHISLWRKEHPR